MLAVHTVKRLSLLASIIDAETHIKCSVPKIKHTPSKRVPWLDRSDPTSQPSQNSSLGSYYHLNPL